MHPDAELVSKLRPGTTVHGRDDIARFVEEAVAPNLYEISVDVTTVLDETRVVVEGRIRWIDDERVIRDDPVIWAMEFREDLLYRFIAVRTVLEAEAVLASD